MSIFKVLSNLNKLKQELGTLSPKSSDFEKKYKSMSSKLDSLAIEVSKLEPSADLMSEKLKEIQEAKIRQATLFESSPVKAKQSPMGKPFGSPTKPVLDKFDDSFLLESTNRAFESRLSEKRETPEYVKRIAGMQHQIETLEKQLQELITIEKESMIKNIMENQLQENRIAVQHSVNEFFGMLCEQGGIFEKVVSGLQEKREKNILNQKYPKNESRSSYDRRTLLEEALNKKESLFSSELGSISTSPDYFFDFNETAKALSEHFMKNLYEDSARKAVISAFHQQKRQGLRLFSLNRILSAEVLAECKISGIYPLYRVHPNTGAREEITEPLTENGDEVLLDENKLAELFDSVKERKSADLANVLQQQILRDFEELPLNANIEGCISFFPIKIISENREEKLICLVVNSGEASKIKGEKGKVELANLQHMLKTFTKTLGEFQPIDSDQPKFSFVYFDKEQPGMDHVLNLMSQGFSGTEHLLEPQKDFDPYRACAEKKLVAFLNELNTQNTSFEVMGSANRRIAIVDSAPENVQQSVVADKQQDEKGQTNALDYQPLLDELNLESAITVEGRTRIRALIDAANQELGTKCDAIWDKAGKLYPPIDGKLPASKQIKVFKEQLEKANKKSNPATGEKGTQITKTNKASSRSSTDTEGDFIPCCTSCKTIKMPVLTLFEVFRMNVAKQRGSFAPVTIHAAAQPVIFTIASPVPAKFHINPTTGLTPQISELTTTEPLDNQPKKVNAKRSLFDMG